MSSALNVALPSIGQELRLDPILLGWLNTSFLLAITPFLIPFGRLGDIYGRKKILLVGIYLLLASLLLITISHSGGILIAIRVLQGFAGAMMYSNVIPMLVAAVPLNKRGHALGVLSATTFLGFAVGPFLGGIITYQFGWRYIFWFLFLVNFTVLLITHFRCRSDWREDQGETFDSTGAIFLGVGILATMYGFSTLTSLSGALLVAAGILCLTFFAFFEMRISHPIVNMDLFLHNSLFAFSNLAALISYVATFAVSFLLSLYFQNVKALTPQLTGLILVAQPIVQVVFSPISGHLSDRIEPRLLASGGMACKLLGLIMLIFLGRDTPIFFVVISLTLIGLGFALFSSPNANAVMSSVDRQVFGVASATLSTMRQGGMALSMGIVMISLSVFLGGSNVTPDNPGQFLNSMRVSFGICALACLGGVFASLARGNVRR